METKRPVASDDSSSTLTKKAKTLEPKQSNTKEPMPSLPSKRIFQVNPLKEASNMFKLILTPVTPDQFFEKHWEKKALHVQRQNNDYYNKLFTSSELDRILRENLLYYTRNIDVVSYENGLKEVHNPEGVVVPSAVWDYYTNGCSIRLLNPQTYHRKLRHLITNWQEYFGTMVGANVYLTPPDSQGFAPHFDDIEAFVVQLEGRKHWKLYTPKKEDELARYSSPNLKKQELGKPFMNITLNAGDMLYFPRGTIHEGRTDADMHSLHVTVSVYQRTAYADLMEHAIQKALKTAIEKDPRFRKQLPRDFLKECGIINNKQNWNTIKGTVGELVRSLTNYLDVDYAVGKLGQKFMHDSMPSAISTIGGFDINTCKLKGIEFKNNTVVKTDGLNMNMRIRLLRYYCLRVVKESATDFKMYYNVHNALFYHGEDEQFVSLEPYMVPAVYYLQKKYPDYVEIKTLPIDNDDDKLKFVSKLTELHLLVAENP